jgi:hypothetical protein
MQSCIHQLQGDLNSAVHFDWSTLAASQDVVPTVLELLITNKLERQYVVLDIIVTVSVKLNREILKPRIMIAATYIMN